MRLVPVTLSEAKTFVQQYHRHNDAPVGHKVSVGLADANGELIGVGVLSMPRARMSNDGRTLEVVRVAVKESKKNANSMLYGALTRMAWAMGYDRLITYTLPDESGASLRASGWTEDAVIDQPAWRHTTGPRSADKPTLFYEPKTPTGKKVRWVKERPA